MHSALLLAVISQLAACDALASVTWRMPNVPEEGLSDITFPINIANAPHTSGYYFAEQFGFKNESHVGYTGLQPRADANNQTIIHGVFSSFITGSTSEDPNCSDGADGGNGVSCSFEFVGDYADTWNMVVNTTGGNTWTGTAVNTRTGVGKHIGSYTLPDSVGGISDSNFGFVEYYPWNSNPSLTCADIPFTQGTLFAPISKSTKNGTATGTVVGSITSCQDYITKVDTPASVEFTLE
ncbi:gp24-like protein [Ophiostoma piceae UAMH 11346]|uniref:Gp24-like protein n=1 Tax=Ophiostoma piceae (strain UAMH 11346) TaxID=1262450 RepID=S3BX99_OPHP1|nr:gp24-like protein [Ophiostoma piceae UAMH 11346]